MDTLVKLLHRMEQASLVPHLSMGQHGIDAALDARDFADFADKWMSVFRQVEAVRPAPHDAEACVRRLRELAYIQAYERWHSPDLAAYISDDFGLIGHALANDVRDPWLNGLLDAYLMATFPHGNVVERAGALGASL